MLTGIKERNRQVLLYREDIYRGNLILVNRRYPVNNSFEKSEAAEAFENSLNGDVILEKTAANMLTQLLRECGAGNRIIPVSGFRSLKEQQQIFSESIKENGEAFTFKYVALPNHSEHQTGLAVDMAQNHGKIDFLCPSFPYDGICGEFRRKASKYGFIERYGKGKEAITGISHEPWHFRYVGYPHSEIMEKNLFSLEEYIEYINAYKYGCNHLIYNNNQHVTEIFYFELKGETGMLSLDEYVPYQLSGNNRDGFIITVWRNSLWGKAYE